MDDNSSLGKVSSSTESVATVTSEEFVLVQSSAAGSPQGSGGKPRLKVRTTQGETFRPDQSVMLIPPQYTVSIIYIRSKILFFIPDSIALHGSLAKKLRAGVADELV